MEVLKIYKESIYGNNDVRDGFDMADKIPDYAVRIFIPNAGDGTMVRILRQYGVEQDIYVSEPEKKYRAMLHRMPNTIVIDDRMLGKIDLIRICGKYKKNPECKDCKNEPASCKKFLGLPDQQFDAVVSLSYGLDKNILQKFSGNVILLESNTEEQN
ncbi:hypothetical protein KAR91_33950 [Candidatus Pacearchaeota archaeon]|nr:hypothetical protein [Candidatus Pacearchaeota archaeon]